MKTRTLPNPVFLVLAVLALLLWLLAVRPSPGTAAAKKQALLTTISVTAGKPSEFKFTLSKTSAKKGIILFKVKNSGGLPHDFELCSRATTNTKANNCTGKKTKLLNRGQVTTLRVTVLKAGKYQYLCTVAGHAAAGMKGLLTVK